MILDDGDDGTEEVRSKELRSKEMGTMTVDDDYGDDGGQLKVESLKLRDVETSYYGVTARSDL